MTVVDAVGLDDRRGGAQPGSELVRWSRGRRRTPRAARSRSAAAARSRAGGVAGGGVGLLKPPPGTVVGLGRLGGRDGGLAKPLVGHGQIGLDRGDVARLVGGGVPGRATSAWDGTSVSSAGRG